MFGVLNINKPAGWTSRDVVNRVQRLVRPAKAGHAGTLDPLATGVLVVCVGPATKLIPYAQQLRKTYRAAFLLGRRSETEDLESEVEELIGAPEPTAAELAAALTGFDGDILQRPSRHSAIKVGGQRAYKRARSGEQFELPARTVTIYRIDVLRYEYPELELEIECGSGTYIRAIGRDLAAALGTVAVMTALRRTSVGRLHQADAVEVGALLAAPESHLLAPNFLVEALPQRIVTSEELRELQFGRDIEMRDERIARRASPGPSTPTEFAAVDAAGRLVALVRQRTPGRLSPIRNFSQAE